jgi:hypothetical protein
MKRHEIEVVVLKSFDYWKSILGNEIDLGDVQALTNFVWESMKEDQELDAQIERVYVITRRSVQRLVTKGINTFHDIYGNRIVLRFEDRGEPPCVLESGTIFLSKEHFTNYEDEKKNHNKMLKGIIVEEERSVDVQSRLDEFFKPKKDTSKEKKQRKDNDK